MVGHEFEVTAAATGQQLDNVRGQRRSLRRALGEVEIALATPATGHESEWARGLADAIEHLSEVFDLHIEVTEGPGGLYEDVMEQAPRLANVVRRFRAEHATIRMAINNEKDRLDATLAGEPLELDHVRTRVTRLLGRMVRHRQQGAELVYEAYEVDIGGES
jgi:hypothetical protein